MQSPNVGRFSSILRISSQQESSTSEVADVMFDMIGLGSLETATMPPDSMVFTDPVLPLSFTEYGPEPSVYGGPAEH
jgi:hypothetical protein